MKYISLSLRDLCVCAGRITSCNIPLAGSHDLLGNYETLDCFWIKNPELYHRWEAIQLPHDRQGISSSSESKLRHRIAGNARVDYVYEGEHLIQRVWSCPDGTITETIETDEAGRIVGLSRTPENWRDFWPWQTK